MKIKILLLLVLIWEARAWPRQRIHQRGSTFLVQIFQLKKDHVADSRWTERTHQQEAVDLKFPLNLRVSLAYWAEVRLKEEEHEDKQELI